MKVLAMQYITDLYGDVPYSQALQAAKNVTQPAYDKQQDIYNAMLSRTGCCFNKIRCLPNKNRSPTCSHTQAMWQNGSGSVIPVMLRLAMRLTKADLATAQRYAEKAAAGGTLASVAEDAYIKGDNAAGYRSENSRSYITPADFYQVRWSKPLIDFLKSTNDPRVSAIAEIPLAGLLQPDQDVTKTGDNDFADQMGLPAGFDLNGGATDISKAPGYPGGSGTGGDFTPIGLYSRPRVAVYTDLNSPQFILTYAESELLLAEAKVRGWNVGALQLLPRIMPMAYRPAYNRWQRLVQLLLSAPQPPMLMLPPTR